VKRWTLRRSFFAALLCWRFFYHLWQTTGTARASKRSELTLSCRGLRRTCRVALSLLLSEIELRITFARRIAVSAQILLMRQRCGSPTSAQALKSENMMQVVLIHAPTSRIQLLSRTKAVNCRLASLFRSAVFCGSFGSHPVVLVVHALRSLGIQLSVSLHSAVLVFRSVFRLA
jgi:hypothetical protein